MSDYTPDFSKNLLRITGAKRVELSQHRLQQYTTYPNRHKYYHPSKTFAQVLKELQSK